jgi:hypothetical protein
MSLDTTRVIDAIGVDRESKEAVLTIADAYDWIDTRKHLKALQEKINAYLDYIESKDIYETYPNASGRDLRIDIIFREPPPESAIAFISAAREVTSQLDVSLTWRLCG